MSLAGVWIAVVFLIVFTCNSNCLRIPRAKNEGPAQKLKESKSRPYLLPLVRRRDYSSQCAHGDPDSDRNLSVSCHGGQFQQSSGYIQPCRLHSDCYDWREPPEWCPLQGGYLWTDAGCHCDPKIGSCIIERHYKALSSLEWTYCTPKNEFKCGPFLNKS